MFTRKEKEGLRGKSGFFSYPAVTVPYIRPFSITSAAVATENPSVQEPGLDK